MKVIAVTGSTGTGKTYISKILSKEVGYSYIAISKLGRDIYSGYDKSRKTKIVDVNKMISEFKKLYKKYKGKNKKGIIFDTHLSHYLPKNLVDICLVLACDIKKLKKILEKRGYNNKKIRENIDAEIFEVCYNEALGQGHKILKIDTSKRLTKKAWKIILRKVNKFLA